MSFSSENLDLVEYQILFNKRDLEAILERETQLVSKTLSDEGFASWKIAEFTQRLRRDGIPLPANWTADDARAIGTYDPGRERIVNINSDELDSLEVESQVLQSTERGEPKYTKARVSALNRIAAALAGGPGSGVGKTGSSSGGSGSRNLAKDPTSASKSPGRADHGWSA